MNEDLIVIVDSLALLLGELAARTQDSQIHSQAVELRVKALRLARSFEPAAPEPQRELELVEEEGQK
jgi:hypothetical protein